MSDLMDKERLLKGNGLSFTTQEYITPQGSESMGLIIQVLACLLGVVLLVGGVSMVNNGSKSPASVNTVVAGSAFAMLGLAIIALVVFR
jgi:hypothetical protein